MPQRRGRRTNVVKVKNAILKEPNQKEGNDESTGQKFTLCAIFVSLVHLWEVINHLGGYLTWDTGVFKCCWCSFIYLGIFSCICLLFIGSCISQSPGSKQKHLWFCEGASYGGIDGVKAPMLDLRYLSANNKGELWATLHLKWQREITMISASVVCRSCSLNCRKDFPLGAVCRNQLLPEVWSWGREEGVGKEIS